MVPIVPETGNFRNDFTENFRNDIPERSGNFRFTKKIVPEFRFSGTFSVMEMEKISGSFPYVNRNPEFRWKPYLEPAGDLKTQVSNCTMQTQ